MDQDKVLSIGKMIRMFETDLSIGFEFINLVSLIDGSVVSYLNTVMPKPPVPDINIEFAIVTGPGQVVLADANAGLLSWYTDKPNDVAWRLLSKLPAFLVLGDNGALLLIGADRMELGLIDAKSGKIKLSGRLPEKATGEPIKAPEGFFVPVEDGVIHLGADLAVIEKISVPGANGNVAIYSVPGGILVLDSDELISIKL